MKGRRYDDEMVEQMIRKAEKDLRGEDITFSLETVDKIPKEKSGKRRQIISYVDK